MCHQASFVPTTGNKQCEHNLSTTCEQISRNLFAELQELVRFYVCILLKYILLKLKPVFHFKRTVPKRIKNVFKFQNFVNVDWLVLP
jgi:hypothetical protein